MEYISFEHNNIAADLVKQAYDTPPLAFVHSYGCQQNVNHGERIRVCWWISATVCATSRRTPT